MLAIGGDTWYILPGDGAQARKDFLALLRSPGETWIRDYGFTEADLVTEIEAADTAGVSVHLILDKSQEAGHAELPIVTAMAARLQHSDVTISTAGPRSAKPDQIMHTKAMVVDASDGDPWCFVGSVNFSESGWYQANLAVVFRSQAFADAFVEDFNTTRDWAKTHVKQLGG